MQQNKYRMLQQSYYVCTEHCKYPSSFELSIQLCSSNGNLCLDKLLLFLDVVYNSFYRQFTSMIALMQLKEVSSHLVSNLLRRKLFFAWSSLWNRTIAFAHLPLVHICRMMERRAHRKEFRRKACLNYGSMLRSS